MTNPTTAIGLALGNINGSFNLDVALSLLERSNKGRILSTPRVSTQNNIEAEIMQGVQIPIQTVANNTVTVTWKDAALILRVLPQITVRQHRDHAHRRRERIAGLLPCHPRQPADQLAARTTQVRVVNGDTTVIGGIFLSTEQAAQSRTPGLGNVPVLGWLFKRTK